jgi:RHS repeat-associated protein
VTNRSRTGSILNEYTLALDVLGQPTQETVTNGPALQFTDVRSSAYTYNKLNQAVTLDGSNSVFAYDLDGNMKKGLTGDGRSFVSSYNADNRLKSIQYTDGSGILRKQEYLYGADGYLGIQKDFADGALTGEQRFIRIDGKVLQERNSANDAERNYIWDITKSGGVGGLMALSQGGQTYQYYSNTRGDITAVLDSAGAVAAAYAYDPFGIPLAVTGTLQQPMRFSTKAYDERTGLYYYGYRFYSPKLGRWLSRDPIGEKGGSNLYAFSKNNPLIYFDPNGFESQNMDGILKPVINNPLYHFIHAAEFTGGYVIAQTGATIGEIAMSWFIRIPDAISGANILNKSNQELQRTTLWEYVHKGLGPHVVEAWKEVSGSHHSVESKEPIITDDGPITIRPAKDRESEPIITDDGPVTIRPARERLSEGE